MRGRGEPVRSVRVLIVDDQAPFRAAAAAVVEQTEPFVLAGAVESGEESLARLPDLVPDLVLMDINLPGMDGIEASTLIAARPEPPTIVLLSTRPPEEYADRIEGCGARAYLEKSEFGPERLAAIWAAASIGRRASDVDSPDSGKGPTVPANRPPTGPSDGGSVGAI